MKRILFLTMIMVCALTASAQTYLDHLQTREEGKGNVTVHESGDIDKLVNGTNPKVAKRQPVKEDVEVDSKEEHETTTETTTTKKTTEKRELKKGQKAKGYRIQVFAGGSTRQDEQKAKSIGNQLKSKFPGQPIFVHFYSPRWICRIGNFVDRAEAESMLTRVRAAGFPGATLVQGVIKGTK